VIVVAGPCVIESEKRIFKIAKGLERLAEKKNVEFYFKGGFRQSE